MTADTLLHGVAAVSQLDLDRNGRQGSRSLRASPRARTGRRKARDGRLGRGCRNRERFRNASYFHLGGLDLHPDALGTHTKS